MSEPSAKRIAMTQDLVETAGCDFEYSDRTESFHVLANCLEARHAAWSCRKKDRNLHPIPFLADGPGTGKSRFLQELPTSFRSFVLSSTHSTPFKKAIDTALYINITFGNGSAYDVTDVAIEIERAICIRILHQIHMSEMAFSAFCANQRGKEITLDDVLELVPKETACIVLGIDEVSNVHDRSKQQFKALFTVHLSIFLFPFWPALSLVQWQRLFLNPPIRHVTFHCRSCRLNPVVKS